MKTPASSICLLLLLGACSDKETAEFGPPRQVPKEQRPLEWRTATYERMHVPDMGAARNHANGQNPNASNAGGAAKNVIANTPAGWEELPADPQNFKNAVWRIKGEPTTSCYLTIAVGGGVAFNLQRWYINQFGKTEVPAVEALPPIEFANRAGRLVEHEGAFGGKPDWAALIAFYNDGNSVTSLKFTGPKGIVKNNRKQFLSLAKSIRLASRSPNPNAPAIRPGQKMPDSHIPVGQGNSGQGNGATADQPPSPFTASAPEDWQAKPGRRILHHTFGSGSEVYVSQLGGTMKQSLDIWRGEMGMDPMTDVQFKALPKTLFLGDDGVLMDLSGKFRGMTGTEIPDARLLVAARVDGSTITFCKLVGPKTDVDSQRDAFVKFCGSIRRTQ